VAGAARSGGGDSRLKLYFGRCVRLCLPVFALAWREKCAAPVGMEGGAGLGSLGSLEMACGGCDWLDKPRILGLETVILPREAGILA
jgi:hypothetical protein